MKLYFESIMFLKCDYLIQLKKQETVAMAIIYHDEFWKQ